MTKDTILDLIISTEKNQKGKIFGINEDNKILNNSANLINNGIQNIPFQNEPRQISMPNY